MASEQKDVEKGLVLVSSIIFTEQEQKDQAKAISANMALKFTQNRGPTQMGAAQGEHATAYALYVEFVMAMVGRYISAGQNSNYMGISDLLIEMKDRPKQDQILLDSFELQGNINLGAFEELDEQIQKLRVIFSSRVNAQAENINAMKKLQQLSTQGLTEEVIEGIKALNPDALKAEIATIRGEYFFTIAQKIAEEYLLFQNKSLHVAFRKVLGQEADSGEGAQIAGALKALRACNQPGLGFASPSAPATSSRASLPRAAKSATAEAEDAAEVAFDAHLAKIVANIKDLLFYPKVVVADVTATTKKGGAADRSNDTGIFCYVVARHISIIFATFKELGKEPYKKQITDKFILKMTQDWGFEANIADELKDKIIKALEKAEKPSYEVEALDVSLDGGSPLKKVTASVGGISRLTDAATRPLYSKQLQEGSEAKTPSKAPPGQSSNIASDNNTPSKAPPGQSSDTASDKKKKKWW